MVQFNLLPDVKIEFIRTKRLKRLILGISIVAIIVSVLLTMFMFSLKTVQTTHNKNLDKKITKLSAELESTPDLNKILSVQNQLNSLPELYAGRPAVFRLPTFLDQTTPTDVGIRSIIIDFSTSTIEIQGKAESLESVNRYADTLKFTKYISVVEGGEPVETTAFSDVVLPKLTRDDKETSFTVIFTFTPAIFDDKQNIQLIIPSQVTTRSQATQNVDLFNVVEEEVTE